MTARVLVKSTCFRTGNRRLRAANRGHEPKTKTPQGRFNFWLGRTRGNGGVPPFPFWEICDFPKWLQNINNVLQCKCETYLHNPCEYQIKNTPVGCFLFGWGARIRTMIKRTKISCPTIRRHPKSNTDYKYLLRFCNNIFTIMHIKAKKIKKFIIFPLAFCLLKTIIIQVFNN